MSQFISAISLVVADYDKALAFYVNVLGFELIEDTLMGEDREGQPKRWVVVRPQGAQETQLLLARAATPEQKACIGNQTGGRVFLFLKTDSFDADYERFKTQGVKFLEAPRNEAYGKVVVFQDPFGNKWDLLEKN